MFTLSKFKKISLVICLFLTGIALYFSFQFNNYQQTVGKVISEKTISKDEHLDEHGNKDAQTQQELEIRLLNSTYQGEIVHINNSYTFSQVKDHQYHQNDYVFLHVTKENNQFSGNIIELKRDHFLILLISTLIMLLILVSGKSGLLTFLSFIINGVMLAGLLVWYRSINSNLLLILLIGALPVIVTTTLIIANGWNIKTKIATLSTIIGSIITFLLGFIVIELLHHQGLHYEEMELVTRPPHVLFLSSLLIGCVGAVMDVSITIVASLFELIETKEEVTLLELEKTGKQIGEDIMGPMTNIMFFSYLSGAIPLVLIFLRNGMSFSYTFSIILSLEIARALVGSIGIILAVPISIKTTHYFLKKRWQNER